MAQIAAPGPETTAAPGSAALRSSPVWRRLVPRIVLATGTAAVAGTLLIAGVLTHFMVREIIYGMGRYARSVAADYVGPCLLSPRTWSKTSRVGGIDAYDASTLESPNPRSPPLDALLRERLLGGESHPARLFWSRDGGWGGIVLRNVAAAGPCGIFQVRWRAAPGSSGRGLFLLVTLTLVAIGTTMALSTLVTVRPLLSRLSRLRRAAAQLDSLGGYEPVPDRADDEIGRLAAILDRTHGRVLMESALLRERQKQLERRLGDVAHDFRTPLSSALISLELAARLTKRKNATETIRRALTDVVYTAQLTENLRLLTQLSQGDEPPDGEAVTLLNEVVERVVARFALLGRHRGVSLDGAVPPRALLARGHPVWTEQALANVAHNAVTHTEAGAHVAVVLEAAGDDRFCVSVVDDGPGVSPADLARLAERRFRSGRAGQRAPGGSGLGLAITAEICRQSGWTLRFATGQPRGLRVTIEGPLLPTLDGQRHLALPL
jgi:signal transduction histidine kinase